MPRGKHKSAASDLDLSLRWLESLDSVKKVVLGKTENCRHSYPPGYVRYKSDTEGGIKVNGYSGNGVIDIFIRCESDDRENVAEKLKTKFGSGKKK